jgi:hypothetical protein
MIVEQLAIVAFAAWLNRALCSASSAPRALMPDDDKPEGVSPTSLGINDLKGPSGAKYSVTSFPMEPASVFHVARAKRNSDWISFVFDQRTGIRSLWRISAGTPRRADILRKDFVL